MAFYCALPYAIDSSNAQDLGAVESAHAAIMEKYIAEKLGAGKDDRCNL